MIEFNRNFILISKICKFNKSISIRNFYASTKYLNENFEGLDGSSPCLRKM